MIEGEIKNGYKFRITDEALDDWELLEDLSKADEGNIGALISAVKRLLGEKGFKDLKAVCRDGQRVSSAEMTAAICEIFEAVKEIKNS